MFYLVNETIDELMKKGHLRNELLVSSNVYNERNFMVRISAATFDHMRTRVLQVGIRALV